VQQEVSQTVIMRIWHGYTKPDDGDNYERMLKDEILPGEFAGTDQTKSVIHPKAHALLTRCDESSEHFDPTWVA